MTQALLDTMIEHPVVAAVRDEKALVRAVASPVRVVFLLSAAIQNAPQLCRQIQAAGKQVFLHVDLVEGLKADAAGMRYVQEQVRPEGIISTKPSCIRLARKTGLVTIQRVFLIDSAALHEGAGHIRHCQPDLVEVLPGVSSQAIRLAVEAFKCPLIAGGLIRTREAVFSALAAGALAASTACAELWAL